MCPLVVPIRAAASLLLLVFVGRLQALLMAATMLGRLVNAERQNPGLKGA